MSPKKVIVVSYLQEVSVFGSLKLCCEKMNLPYHSLKSLPFPFWHFSHRFDKVYYNHVRLSTD